MSGNRTPQEKGAKEESLSPVQWARGGLAGRVTARDGETAAPRPTASPSQRAASPASSSDHGGGHTQPPPATLSTERTQQRVPVITTTDQDSDSESNDIQNDIDEIVSSQVE